jgi:hypothetical protein
MIAPVFAHTKHNRTITRFHRTGRTAVRTKWRLLIATHNLTKLHRQQPTAAGAQNKLPGAHTAKTRPTGSHQRSQREGLRDSLATIQHSDGAGTSLRFCRSASNRRLDLRRTMPNGDQADVRRGDRRTSAPRAKRGRGSVALLALSGPPKPRHKVARVGQSALLPVVRATGPLSTADLCLSGSAIYWRELRAASSTV